VYRANEAKSQGKQTARWLHGLVRVGVLEEVEKGGPLGHPKKTV